MAAGDFLYQKVYNTLAQQIGDGVFPAGERLPPEKKLQQEFGVSAITVKKALGLLAERGYVKRIPGRGTFVPTPAESSPAAAGCKKIGLILEHISSPFGLTMFYHMDQLMARLDYKLCVRFSYGNRDRETEEIDFLLGAGVEGLIIMPSHGQHYNPAILKLVLDNFPVILIDKALRGIEIPSVRTDNIAAMHHLVGHLADMGCKRIGLITSHESGATSLEERRQGFYDGIRERGLPVCPECSFAGEVVLETQEQVIRVATQIRQYLQTQRPALDGVICAEYGIIPKLVRAAREIPLTLDRDLQVCCIDEDDGAPGGYTFTHMKQDETAIAEKAVQLLHQRMAQEPPPAQDILVPAIFKVKGSA